jgi:mitochondrial fission protein ELM1
MKPAIQCLILSDGKPGHVTNSMGVLKAIETLVAAESVVLQVRLRLKMMRYPLRWLLNRPALLRRIPAGMQRRLMRLVYTINEPQHLDPKQPFDWVISSGGDTSFMNVWLAQRQSLRNMYCSALRGLNPALFTVYFSLGAASVHGNNIRVPFIPLLTDRARILEQGRQFRTVHGLEHQTVWCVLIGGDGAGYHYDSTSLEQLAQGLLALARGYQAKLLVTTSRRTGLKLERVLKSVLGDCPAVAYATYYNHRPEKVVASFLGAADLVFCTADSGSMITEAMTAGKPVYSLIPEQVRPQPFYQAFLQSHADAHRIKPVAIGSLHTLNPREDAASYFQVLERDTTSELAAQLNPWVRPGEPCA